MVVPRPNTFLIGGPKSGTTSLAHYLSEHPDVFLGYPKEPSYWSFDLAQSETVAKIKSLHDYERIFSKAKDKKIILDASTRYLFSRVAVREIVKYNPESKFIAIVRNPIEVSQAYHMEKVFNHFEDQIDFEVAWRLQDERILGKYIPAYCDEAKELQYRDVAKFGAQLQAAMEHIPVDNILILFTEDLARDPRRVYLELTNFLNLPDDGRFDFPVKGSSHFNRFPRFSRYYQNPPRAFRPLVRPVKRIIRTAFPKAVADTFKRILVRRGTRKGISRGLRSELVKEFREDINLIEALTGRKLEHWLDVS